MSALEIVVGGELGLAWRAADKEKFLCALVRCRVLTSEMLCGSKVYRISL